MILTIVGILVVLWLAGLLLDVGGSLIHTILVIAGIVFIFNLVTGRNGK